MAKSRRIAPRERHKDGSTLAFFSADNWVLMKQIGMKLAELRSKLNDKDLAEVTDAFNVIERQFDRMYRRVGEEIWISDGRKPIFCPEYGPEFTRLGRKGRIPAKQLESLKKIPGLIIEIRLPGEERIQNLMPANKEEDVSNVDQEKVKNIEECYRLLKEIGELPPIVELLKKDQMISLVWDDRLNGAKVLTTEKLEEVNKSL